MHIYMNTLAVGYTFDVVTYNTYACINTLACVKHSSVNLWHTLDRLSIKSRCFGNYTSSVDEGTVWTHFVFG